MGLYASEDDGSDSDSEEAVCVGTSSGMYGVMTEEPAAGIKSGTRRG